MKIPKKVQLHFPSVGPMQLSNLEETDDSGVSSVWLDSMEPIYQSVGAYLKAAKELLQGKYKHLAHLAPEYLSKTGNVLVAICTDGVVIRYETKVENSAHVFAYLPESFAKGASILSQYLIRCRLDGSVDSSENHQGIDLRLSLCDSEGNLKQESVRKIVFDITVTKPQQLPLPPQKPYCLLSVRNSFEILLHGEMMPVNKDDQGEPFITRSKIRLPVGWECIEIFPYIDIAQWKPENAFVWAENDILALTLEKQLRESHYQSLDPKSETRKQYANLLDEFKTLLDSEPEREQTLQTFLETHPKLLCPAHVQMWSKLPFGARCSDFVFRDGLNEYILTEIERSTHRLFKQDGHATVELTHAQGQIVDWKRYLEDNLSTVQRELGLSGISAHPRALIVIGRSRDLTEQNRRKLRVMESENPKLKVMTYDDVYDNAKATIENLLGPLWEPGGDTRIYYPGKT